MENYRIKILEHKKGQIKGYASLYGMTKYYT